jgi:hypothetical protein
MKKIILLVLTGCLLLNRQATAGDSTNAVKQFMQQVQQAYKSACHLGFHVLYRYANKSQPDNYIDTMSGEVAMDKNHVRFSIEGVETITNDRYTIQINNNEKLIYLATPQPVQVTNPVSMLDSALAHFDGITTRVSRNSGIAMLNLTFPPRMPYKSVTMTINESTGYFQKVVYEMYTEGLVSKDQLMQSGKGGPYQSEGRVEVVFSQYRQGQFTDGLFSEAPYFTRLAQGKYEPTEKYKDYQIFLASPKL